MSHVIVSAIFLSGAAWLIKFDCIGIGGSYSSRRQPIVREESQFPPRKWVSLSLSLSFSLSPSFLLRKLVVNAFRWRIPIRRMALPAEYWESLTERCYSPSWILNGVASKSTNVSGRSPIDPSLRSDTLPA